MRDVVRQVVRVLEMDRELILCQVVETRESTPQKGGAVMVVDPTGGQIGTLGGGCVENEVKQKAMRQLGGTGAALHSFLLDHDYGWADGLICGGKMVIVSQPLRGAEPLAYFLALERPGKPVRASRKPWSSIPNRTPVRPWGADFCSMERDDYGRVVRRSRHPSGWHRGSRQSLSG